MNRVSMIRDRDVSPQAKELENLILQEIERKKDIIHSLEALEDQNLRLRQQLIERIKIRPLSDLMVESKDSDEKLLAAKERILILHVSRLLAQANLMQRQTLTSLLAKQQSYSLDLPTEVNAIDKKKLEEIQSILKNNIYKSNSLVIPPSKDKENEIVEESPLQLANLLVSLRAVHDDNAPNITCPLTFLDDENLDLIKNALLVNHSTYIENKKNKEKEKDASFIKTEESNLFTNDTIENYGFTSVYKILSSDSIEFDLPDTVDYILTTKTSYGEQIKCATLEKLIQRLTHRHIQDLNTRYVFFLTYQTFTSSEILLNLLKHRFCIPFPPNMTPTEINLFKKYKLAPIQIKVFSVLKYWLEEYYKDFEDNPQLAKQLHDLIQDMLKDSAGPWSAKSAKALSVILLRKGVTGKSNILDTRKREVPLVDGNIPIVFDQCPVLEIARQLTLLDWEKFSQIAPRECLGKAWSKQGKEKKAPNIVAMINQFNKICCWVQYEILKLPLLYERTQILMKFLKIAESLPKPSLQFFESLVSLFSVNKGNKMFRSTLQKAVTPCIPHLGIFLGDLTFIEDGNPDELNGMINFGKRCMIADRIMWIKQYQQTDYPFVEVKSVRDYFKENIKLHDTEELWQISEKLESPETMLADSLEMITSVNS